MKKKRRNPFAGTNVGRRLTLNSLGGEPKERRPISLPKISIQRVDEDKSRTTEPLSTASSC